tara:strand:- start:25012 stop:25242 length:231 start_codon:yes stop_codon:yes gene_type:complete
LPQASKQVSEVSLLVRCSPRSPVQQWEALAFRLFSAAFGALVAHLSGVLRHGGGGEENEDSDQDGEHDGGGNDIDN